MKENLIHLTDQQLLDEYDRVTELNDIEFLLVEEELEDEMERRLGEPETHPYQRLASSVQDKYWELKVKRLETALHEIVSDACVDEKFNNNYQVCRWCDELWYQHDEFCPILRIELALNETNE
jgi:hypothetical protein